MSYEQPEFPDMVYTPEELARMREAYEGTGEAHTYLAGIVEKTEGEMSEDIVFPLRGKAHNQWYQCDDCQIGLETVDDTHHRCPRCEKVYTGHPYDDVIYGRISGKNLVSAYNAGWIFQVTGDRKYAEHTAAILLGYAERYLSYPFHDNQNRVGDEAGTSGGRLIEQTLGEASTMVGTIAPAYGLIRDAGVLSTEQQGSVENDLIIPMLEGIDRNKRGKSNWQSWHNAAMLCGGAVIGNSEWVDKAIHQEGHGFLYQMEASVSGDGFWFENSWGYHVYTLSALVGLCEGARRLGIDLWHHPALLKMCTLPAFYTMPDGKLPGFNDSHSRRPSGVGLEAAYAVFKDPVILSLLDTEISFNTILHARDVTTSAAPVVNRSQLFAETGHAILRASGSSELAAILDFAPHGGGHGHYDALALQLYGYGRPLGLDRGMAKSQAYRLPIHRNWYKTTLSHNTVLMDREGREEGECALVFYAEKDGYAAVGARDMAPCEGVVHNRALVLTPDYLVVFDDLESDTRRRFDWMYHSDGDRVGSEDACESTEPEAFTGSEYFENTKTGVSDQIVRVEFVGSDVTTYLTLAAHPGTEVLTGDGPGETVLQRIPLAMITHAGAGTQFAAVVEPVKNGAQRLLSDLTLQTENGCMTLTISIDDRVDIFTLTKDGGFVFDAGGQRVLSGE